MAISRRQFLQYTGAGALTLLMQQSCTGMDKIIYNASNFFGSFMDGVRAKGRRILVPPYQTGLNSGHNYESALLTCVTTSKSPSLKFQFRDRINLKKVDQRKFRGTTMHYFHIPNLNPGSDYPYEIPGEGIKGTLKTAHRRKDDFSFLLVSDTQNEKNSKQLNRAKASLVKLMMQERKDHRFLINCGDVTEHSYIKEYVYNFFPAFSPLLSHVPFYPVKGNHDYKGVTFDYLFGYKLDVPGRPVRSKWAVNYSFDYGNVHFVVLDSNWRHRDARKFLKKDLARSRAKFNLVFMHHPFKVRTDDLPVHAVFAGHLHNYRRMRHKKTKVPYVVFGGGGCWMYTKDITLPVDQGYDLEEIVNVHLHHYLSVDAHKDYIDVRMRDVNGFVRDSFTIRS